ncbi:MAG: hypothetical protein GY795_07330, partial [Desulfobacterales bacterium]|nr:hypothetical protein [Desulfobacterales bacterium]
VQVSDGTYTGTATVTVNVGNLNDNSPVLNDRTFSVDENSADDTVIGRIEAGDADNDILTYAVIPENTNNVFGVNSITGEIMVNDSNLLDYETTVAHSFKVQITDGKYTDSAMVTVNINNLNDNIPVIQDQTFSIDENSPGGAFVGAVEANDADGYIHTYRIKGGNTDDAFDIKATTGEITINDGSRLDYENKSSYALTVRVFDGEHSVIATITIKLNNQNDNAPIVNDFVFFVYEKAPDGRVFGMVEATDADNNLLEYTITAGNTNNAFAIGASTGYMSVNDSSQLVHEATSYLLTVEVSDGIYIETATVIVNIGKYLITGDIDGSGTVDLMDAVTILKVLTGTAENKIFLDADANGDKKISLEDIIYILQKISGTL